MKKRFIRGKKQLKFKNLLVSSGGFAAAFLAFILLVSSVSRKTEAEELRILDEAVSQKITQCYAIEGTYPSSLAYLKKNYGLYYNEEKYFIDYQPQGSNLLPYVTIIKKSNP